MSERKIYTTADYVPWDTAMTLIRQLFEDGDYRMSLLVGCGCFFGLRISDLRCLTWNQVLGSDEFTIWEQKTGKRRVIRVNAGFREHIRRCHDAMKATGGATDRRKSPTGSRESGRCSEYKFLVILCT